MITINEFSHTCRGACTLQKREFTLKNLMEVTRTSPDDLDREVFSRDGSRLFTDSGGDVFLWDGRSGARIASLPRKVDLPIQFATLSPDGKRVLIARQFVGQESLAVYRQTRQGSGAAFSDVGRQDRRRRHDD